MDTLSYKTQSARKETVSYSWFVVDAEGQPLGRLASKIATVLRGKHKPCYTPHVDCGDYVIVLNAEKVLLTGNKLTQKVHYTHSGYPGGQKQRTPAQILEKHPNRLIEMAVKGMLPKNKLGNAMYKKLFVYEGSEHCHQAQKPSKLEIK
ncbi:MAG: 50S ribosomal protein L13 [Saprospiraceae bacterium]|nr:50S ribosomal protein L13 [Saprospiraceae bacterium]